MQFPIFEKLSSENTIYDICILKADLLLNENINGNLDSKSINYAIRYLDAAKRVSELLRQPLIFDESKYEWGIDLKRASEKLIQCYYLLYQQTVNKQYAQKAFLIAEESKATALQDNTEHNILANEQADTNYAKFIELRKQLNDIEVLEMDVKNDKQKRFITCDKQPNYFTVKHL